MKATSMNMMKRLGAGASAACLVATLGLTGCASSDQGNTAADSGVNFSTESTIEQIEIPVKVTTHDGESHVIYDDVISIGEGSTALDVLQATGLDLDVQLSEYGMFVNGVDGIATDGMKGWTFTINGEQVQISGDQAYLQDGDAVEWAYIDMGA